jgi:prolyl 4-hydroxylase
LTNFIYEDYISDVQLCDELIRWFRSNEKLHTTGVVSGKSEVAIDRKKKKCTDFSFDIQKSKEEEKVVDFYCDELQVILERYLSVYGLANKVEPFLISEPVNIQYYKPYEGFIEPHCERSGHKSTIARHLVFQTYLNTIEDGGETEFFHQQYKCKAVKGKTVIWPADWTHHHRGIVSPTEDKYIITGWYSFHGI